MTASRKPRTCYLCGFGLSGRWTADHVPPKQFFPEAFRRTAGPQLVTLPAHQGCNGAFQADEEYVVTTLAGFTVGTAAGRLLWQDINSKFAHQQGHRLGRMVLREFEKRPSGLVLPRGKIAKRFAGERVRRVMWKIAHGLYFLEKGRVLPEATPAFVRLILPDEAPPPEVQAVLAEPEQGRYPGIFAYRYRVFPEAGRLHVWAFRFWDAIGCSVASHDPDCICQKCGPESSEKGSAE